MSTRKYKSKIDPNLKLETLLDKDEKVLWKGKPVKKAFILNKVFAFIPMVIIFLAIDIVFIVMMTRWWNDLPKPVQIFLPIFFVLQLTPVWIWLINIIFAVKQWNYTEYMVTNRRIIIKSGLFAAGFQSIYYNEIKAVNVHVGLIDKWCHVGDVMISSSARGQGGIIDILDPYGVYKIIEKVSREVATDISFPNAYRPENNPGYKTDVTIKK